MGSIDHGADRLFPLRLLHEAPPPIHGRIGKLGNELPLHAVDPRLQKVSKNLENLTCSLADIYLGLFSVFGTLLLIFLGTVAVSLSIASFVQGHASSTSLILLPLGCAWLFSRTFRETSWLFFGFATVWMILLTATLLPFIPEEAKYILPAQVALASAYLLPPLVATVIALKRKRQQLNCSE